MHGVVTTIAAMTLAPIASAERIRGVDIARGVALLGILLVNVRFFFAPLGFALEPSTAIDGSERTGADTAAWAFVETFCSFKFISLFSLLFGFGLAMQAARAQTQGESPWPAGLRRLGILALVGILHWSLVWYGDILMLYAFLGVIALVATRLPQKTLGWLIVGVAGFVAFIALAGAALSAVGLSMLAAKPAPAEIAASDLVERGLDAMMAAQFDPYNPIWIEAERAAFAEGPASDAFVFRCVLYAYGFVAALFSYGWQSLFMMLCGVYAFKAGFFTAEGSAARRRIALPAILVGLTLSICAVAPTLVFGHRRVGPEAPGVHRHAARAHGTHVVHGVPRGVAGLRDARLVVGPRVVRHGLRRTGRPHRLHRVAVPRRLRDGVAVGLPHRPVRVAVAGGHLRGQHRPARGRGLTAIPSLNPRLRDGIL